MEIIYRLPIFANRLPIFANFTKHAQKHTKSKHPKITQKPPSFSTPVKTQICSQHMEIQYKKQRSAARGQRAKIVSAA